MFRVDDGGGLDPASYEGIQEDMDAGEITEAIRYFARSVLDTGRSDEEIEKLVAEFEAICQRMEKLAPFVYYGEAAENLKKSLRGRRM
ncbi:hypothetical protein [Nocardia nova]|uniref:hypothetical protein n=1 Tax=Nocardia nova TaxID=37330 RepID=UPI00273A33F1|nr:hypothetical protein [Nocardia nova]